MQPFLTHMASHYPRMQLKIARGSVELLVQSLRNESVDIIAADRRALLTADDLAIGPVATLRGGFLCRSGHPLTALAQIDPGRPGRLDAPQRRAGAPAGRTAWPRRPSGAAGHPRRRGHHQPARSGGSDRHGVLRDLRLRPEARIAAGRVCEIHVQPHFERFGQYALVTLARRSMSPAVEVFRAFFAENFGE